MQRNKDHTGHEYASAAEFHQHVVLLLVKAGR
jgi:hypothetical protein